MGKKKKTTSFYYTIKKEYKPLELVLHICDFKKELTPFVVAISRKACIPIIKEEFGEQFFSWISTKRTSRRAVTYLISQMKKKILDNAFQKRCEKITHEDVRIGKDRKIKKGIEKKVGICHFINRKSAEITTKKLHKQLYAIFMDYLKDYYNKEDLCLAEKLHRTYDRCHEKLFSLRTVPSLSMTHIVSLIDKNFYKDIMKYRNAREYMNLHHYNDQMTLMNIKQWREYIGKSKLKNKLIESNRFDLDFIKWLPNDLNTKITKIHEWLYLEFSKHFYNSTLMLIIVKSNSREIREAYKIIRPNANKADYDLRYKRNAKTLMTLIRDAWLQGDDSVKARILRKKTLASLAREVHRWHEHVARTKIIIANLNKPFPSPRNSEWLNEINKYIEKVTLLKTPQEMAIRGEEHHICLKSLIKSAQSHVYYYVSINDSKKEATAQIDAFTGEIQQCYGPGNCQNTAAINFETHWKNHIEVKKYFPRPALITAKKEVEWAHDLIIVAMKHKLSDQLNDYKCYIDMLIEKYGINNMPEFLANIETSNSIMWPIVKLIWYREEDTQNPHYDFWMTSYIYYLNLLYHYKVQISDVTLTKIAELPFIERLSNKQIEYFLMSFIKRFKRLPKNFELFTPFDSDYIIENLENMKKIVKPKYYEKINNRIKVIKKINNRIKAIKSAKTMRKNAEERIFTTTGYLHPDSHIYRRVELL